MNHKRLFGFLAIVAIVVAGCGTGDPSSSAGESAGAPASAGASVSGELADDQTLRLTLGAEDPATLDPSKASTSTDIAVLHAINRGLIYFDKDLAPVPALAEALPEISADLLTYTFTLRDAKYNTGDPIVAGDLVYAWKRLIDPRTAASYQSFVAMVAGGQALLDMSGADPAPSDADIDAALANYAVSAPDDKTFVVELAAPTSFFLDIVALWGAAPMQESWITGDQPTEAENYVSSGPFMMESWEHQAEIVLVPNPNWYGLKPTLTKIIYTIGLDPAGSQAAFEGEPGLDMLAASPPDVPRIKDDPELGPLVVTQPVLVFDYWGFDCTKGPTANVHFRRALSMAINKETMLAVVSGGQGVVAGSPIPPGMPGHQPDIGLPYDLTEANKELAIALEELGLKDLPPDADGVVVTAVEQLPHLSFGYNTNAGHEFPAAFMQEQWRLNLGVLSDLTGETFDAFVVNRPLLKFSIARNAWGADYPHPDNFLRALFGSQSGNNDEGYNSKPFDDLVAEAAAEAEFDASIALYNKAQELLVEEAPAVFTRWRISNYEIRPWVDGYIATAQDSNVIGDLFFENIRILQH